MLQLIFKLTGIANSVNAAASCLYTLEDKVMEKIQLQIRQELWATAIVVKLSSSDDVDENKRFFIQADQEMESEEQTLERRHRLGKNASERLAYE